MSLRGIAGILAALVATLAVSAAEADELRDQLWAAVRGGDVPAAQAALDAGANVNGANEIGVTALWIAASNRNLEVVQLLLERDADVNARDGIWYQTPLSLAVGGANTSIVKRLLEAGASDIDAAAMAASARSDIAVLQIVLDTGKVSQDALDAALFSAAAGATEVKAALTLAGAKSLPAVPEEQRRPWADWVGQYQSDNGGSLTVQIEDTGLVVQHAPGRKTAYRSIGPNSFAPLGNPDWSLHFESANHQVDRVRMRRFTAETYYFPAKDAAQPTAPTPEGEFASAEPINWPQFRGPAATGLADGQHPPIQWDVTSGANVRWKTPIPGLGHSCPVVWEDRIFLTTAISGDANPKVRIGNYGDVNSVDDSTSHTWQVVCLDRQSGQILWTQTACAGTPKIKRHLKGSQANCTPATDGKRLVACFGAEGLYCYDFQGKLLWQRDLSTIDSSFAIDREYQWGFASSPIIYNDLVIVQFDLSRDSLIAAYHLEDGSRAWATPRDEIPSWSSPAIWRNSQRDELVTNASQFARGYDPATGQELWRLAKKSEATIPAPVIAGDLVFITSGNRPIQPIFAVKAGAVGDISLPNGVSSSANIAWSSLRGGPYMPTPIVYGPHLYVCSNAGVVTCYESATGRRVYRERIGGTSYTASPVAADGRLYFVSEQGEVRVVQAGSEFALLAVNAMDDICMATPAISGGALLVRSQHFLFALGRD